MATLPDEFKIASATLTDNQAYIASRTRSLIARQRKLTGQAFDWRLRSTRLSLDDFKKVQARLGAIARDNDVVTFSVPVYSESDAGIKNTTAPASKGQYKVTLAGVDGIRIGDFFNFAGHTKAYQITDINSLEITFAPNLVDDVSDLEAVTFDGMEFNCYLQGRPQQYSISGADNFMEVEIQLVERWL